MSKSRLMARVFGCIFLVGTFQIGLMEILYYFIMHAVWSEFKYMVIYPLPMAYAVIGTFCFIIYWYCRPTLRFIDADNRDEELGREQVFAIQNRLVNLPYFIALASFPAFITGGVLASLIINYKMGWPLGKWPYGLLGGLFAGLLAIPKSIIAINWAVRPVLERTTMRLPASEASRTAGIRIDLKTKIVITTLALVLAISGYCVTLGYSQTDAILKNMSRMEKLLPPKAAAGLVTEIEGAADPNIRSSQYFRGRMGSLRTFFTGLILFGLALSLLVSVAVAKQITRPLGLLQSVTKKVEMGEYEETVRMVDNDEIAILGAAFNRMTGEITAYINRSRSLLDSIREAAETLVPASKGLVVIAEQQSSRSIEQASAAEESASSSEEIAAVAKQIAQHAAAAANSAEESLELAQQGRKSLERTKTRFDDIRDAIEKITAAIATLGEQSREIGEAVRIINELSDKTKLLALNASLEAVGGGGDQGKRFQVVANEVRRLAEFSAQATGRIDHIVHRIRKSLGVSTALGEEGERAVVSQKEAIEELTDRFGTILDKVKSSHQNLREIYYMTSQQATASEHMAKAITEVTETARQGSDAAEEIQRTSKQIESLIGKLNSQLAT